MKSTRQPTEAAASGGGNGGGGASGSGSKRPAAQKNAPAAKKAAPADSASTSAKKPPPVALKLPKLSLNFIRPIARRVRRLKASKRKQFSQHSLQMKQLTPGGSAYGKQLQQDNQQQQRPPKGPAAPLPPQLSPTKHSPKHKPQQQQQQQQPKRERKQQQPPPKQQQQQQQPQQQQPQQQQEEPEAQAQEPSPQSSNPSKGSSSYQSVYNLNKLKRDGRRTPDQYREAIQAVQSPSQLSIRSLTEYYQLQPDTQFVSAQDVFHYRGYKKLNKIDEGAFGVVSKALRLADKRVVAVKEVDLRRKRAKRVEEMKRELFMLQKVNHENVVELIEHFIIGQMLVIVMEFCAGNNLTAYLKETAINETEARFLFKQMALSIKVLHKRGFAHRDVKLNNFLLDKTRRVVKVSDFGLSVVSYRHTYGIMMAKTYCGTEPYMAPEILKRNSLGQRSYNPIYADIWSLGVCLFAMLTRTFPFKMHTSQQGLFRAQVARRWRFPRSLRDVLSEEIKDLVSHMLDPEPDRRITITGVMHHPWLNQNQLVVMSFDESDQETASQHNL